MASDQRAGQYAVCAWSLLSDHETEGAAAEELGPEIGPRLQRTQQNSLDVIGSVAPDSPRSRRLSPGVGGRREEPVSPPSLRMSAIPHADATGLWGWATLRHPVSARK